MQKIQIQNINWIDIVDPGKKDIEDLRKNFNFHPLVLNELLVPTLRPKVEHYDYYLYMVLHFPIYHPKDKTSKSVEVDFLITSNTLITVRHGKIQPLQEFWQKCEKGINQPYIQNSTASLLYCLISELNNFCLRQIDHITQKIDKIEKQIFEEKMVKKEEEIVEEISVIRRDILNFRRALKPQNIILESLKLRGVDFFGKSTEPYFSDIIGDHMRVWEMLENHKETIESLQEANDSLLSNRINRIIKILTIFTVIVFPILALSNIFSMSAPLYLPFSQGSLLVMGGMLIGSLIILLIFKQKKWL